MNEIINYNDAVQIIKTAILQSQYRAAKATNAEQLSLYYAVGGYVSANTRTGKWGTGAIDAISEQLQKELPGLRGFSATNIKYMRLFYEAWRAPIEGTSISSLATDEMEGAETPVQIRHLQVTNLEPTDQEAFLSVGFTHHRTILGACKNVDERMFYIHKCAEEHMSVESLKRSIRADDYRHQGTMPNNFSQALLPGQQALRAIATFKDEYLLDFINVEELGERDALDVDERVLEQGVVHNVKNFIMTFGRDFTFVGNQYHLDAFGQDQYIDLLFFNRELNCLVAVELKRGPFKTSYLGQLSGYLNILDGFVRKGHENPSIGIVLCKDMDKAFVDYVVRDYAKPMGVATYKTSKDMSEELLRASPPMFLFALASVSALRLRYPTRNAVQRLCVRQYARTPSITERHFMANETYDFSLKLDEYAEEEDLQKRRDIIYLRLSEFAAKRAAWYRDKRSTNVKKLLSKDVVMFAARGVTTAEEFVNEAFRAYESSSEEGVMGMMWQAIIAAIASDALDTGDMMTVRDGAPVRLRAEISVEHDQLGIVPARAA